jgi:hypothetical protein
MGLTEVVWGLLTRYLNLYISIAVLYCRVLGVYTAVKSIVLQKQLAAACGLLGGVTAWELETDTASAGL